MTHRKVFPTLGDLATSVALLEAWSGGVSTQNAAVSLIDAVLIPPSMAERA